MDESILTIDALEGQVGARPSAADMKVIDHLDAHAQRWLAATPLIFVGLSDPQGVDITLAGGTPGFAAGSQARRMLLPLTTLDQPQRVHPGQGIGLLCLIPGLCETLRINGVVSSLDGSAAEIEVRECYAHCAKALLRSAFWQADKNPEPADIPGYLQSCRFMALATADADLQADLSPKGDPAGLLIQGDADELRFADRPGNRRTDSFRNILSRPHVAALMLIPGALQVLEVRGEACLSADAALRQDFAMQDKIPKLVTRLKPSSLVLRDSAALAQAAPWLASSSPADIDPAAVFAAHVKLNKTKGLQAALVKGLVSIPGLMRSGLEKDYKRNLY